MAMATGSIKLLYMAYSGKKGPADFFSGIETSWLVIRRT